MAALTALRRLLRVRELEEEQAQSALQAAVGELRRVEQALTDAGVRERRGRALVAASAQSGVLGDRLAGLEETGQARRAQAALKLRKMEAESGAKDRRQVLLAKRVERGQVETLIREAEAREALENRRRGQQEMDDWYLGNRQRSGSRSQDAQSGCVVSPCETDKA